MYYSCIISNQNAAILAKTIQMQQMMMNELSTIDGLTMHNGFHPKSNVGRLYLSRSEGSRGLIGIHDPVQTATLELRNYVRTAKEIVHCFTSNRRR